MDLVVSWFVRLEFVFQVGAIGGEVDYQLRRRDRRYSLVDTTSRTFGYIKLCVEQRPLTSLNAKKERAKKEDGGWERC